MNYQFHKDIVYTEVAGISILVTLRGSWDRFPAIKELSPLQACFCQGIERRLNEEEFIQVLRMPKNMKKDKVKELYRSFIIKMADAGYLVKDNTGESGGIGENTNE